MGSDAILILQNIFGNIWRLFNSWHIPGTSITPAALLFSLVVVSIFIKFILSIVNGSRKSSSKSVDEG